MSNTLLEVEDLSIGYSARQSAPYIVAEKIRASLRPGELVCLLGPNGAGKSTLMRTLAGMQEALSGHVRLEGTDVHRMPVRQRARRLAVVLTETVQSGLLTAFDMVALGRYSHTPWSGRLGAEDRKVVQWALDTVSAQDLAERQISDLSDGERQKVMIARALAQEPRLMILDEITAFLDLPRRVEIMRLLRHLVRATGRAVLVSTHDLDLALRSADRLWLMSAPGSSEPLRLGAPEDLVLSGAFEATFASEGVTFDRQAGAFRVHRDSRGEVALEGEGLELLWTRRALERQGLRVIEGSASRGDNTQDGARTRVCVVRVKDQVRWQRTDEDKTVEYDSLYDLTQSFDSL